MEPWDSGLEMAAECCCETLYLPTSPQGVITYMTPMISVTTLLIRNNFRSQYDNQLRILHFAIHLSAFNSKQAARIPLFGAEDTSLRNADSEMRSVCIVSSLPERTDALRLERTAATRFVIMFPVWNNT
jgi:hypothetical protein